MKLCAVFPAALGIFRGYPRPPAYLNVDVEETLLFHMGVFDMKAPTWIKPGIWRAVLGAIGVMTLEFWQMGWVTAGTADRMSRNRADSAVVVALVPFCVANAERDPDRAKLATPKTEQSS